MGKKKSSYLAPGRKKPDDPIYQEGLVIYTRPHARSGLYWQVKPKPKEEPEGEKEPAND